MQNLINAIAIGFSIGIAALISLHLGAGNKEKADMAATHGMVLSLIHGVVISIVCTAIMPQFLRSFTSDETVIAMGVTYSALPLCSPSSSWPPWRLRRSFRRWAG